MKSLSNIKPKYEVVGINNIEVMIDISLVQNTDELYFNASLMARQFDKKTDDFLRLQSTKEYVDGDIVQVSDVAPNLDKSKRTTVSRVDGFLMFASKSAIGFFVVANIRTVLVAVPQAESYI